MTQSDRVGLDCIVVVESELEFGGPVNYADGLGWTEI